MCQNSFFADDARILAFVKLITACRAITREEGDIRLAITPFLQTESDLKVAFMRAKKVDSEAELMKDVKDWEAGASVYKTRYMPPMKVFGLQ